MGPQEIARRVRARLQANLLTSFSGAEGIAAAQDAFGLIADNALAATAAMQDAVLAALEAGEIAHRVGGGEDMPGGYEPGPLTAADLRSLQATLDSCAKVALLAAGRPTRISASMSKSENTNIYRGQETRAANDADVLTVEDLDPDGGADLGCEPVDAPVAGGC